MSHVLLVTSDSYLVTEIEQIASITGTSLIVSTHPKPNEIQEARRIFIDPDSEILALSHGDVWVLTSGPSGPRTWQCAARLNAQNIVSLPTDRQVIAQAFTTTPQSKAHVTAFTSTTGGIGTSTLATHVAAGMARRFSDVVLLDADFTRGGLDITLGQEQNIHSTWTDLSQQRESSEALLPQLATWNELKYVATPVDSAINTHEALQVFENIKYEAIEIVLDCGMTNQNNEWLDLADSLCVVVPNTLRGIAIAREQLSHYELQEKHVGLAVRQLPGASISPMMVAQTLNVPFWGAIPSEARVLELIEQGIGPVPVRGGSFNRNVMNILDHLVGNETLHSAA